MGTYYVVRFLDAQQVPSSQRAQVVHEATGISAASARRRLADDIGWTLEELDSVARHFGRTLPDLIEGAFGPPPVRATLLLGSYEGECLAWLSDDPPTANPTELVAYQTGMAGDWIVGTDPPSAHTVRLVDHVYLRPTRRDRFLIAILDDELDTARSIGEFARTRRYAATEFSSDKELLRALETTSFDAYIMDWLIGSSTSLSLIREIRARDSKCPIIVLTGQIEKKTVREGDLTAAAQECLFEIREKPIRPSILLNSLELLIRRGALDRDSRSA